MKNLLISKSFSYEIVDFTLLRQTNTYHLGGVCSIQLSYEDSNDMKFMKRAFLPPRTLMTGITRKRSLYSTKPCAPEQ